MNKLIFAAAATAALSTTAWAQEGEVQAKSPDAAIAVYEVDTPTFAKLVSASNAFEIRSSQMAGEKATTDEVKELAQTIIADHEKAETDLKAALDGSEAQAPAEAMLAPKQEAMLKQLEAAQGPDFETLYLDIQADSHAEALALFRTYAGSGDDESVVAFAKATLPSLEAHTMHIKEEVMAR